jgi:asparagine synthase (glutamine-hydrolysing)
MLHVNEYKNINYLNEPLTKVDFLQELQNFDFKERQAKYIVNSCRSYDFYNISWTLSFFYNEPVMFFKNIDYHFKIEKKLYIEYQKTQFLFEKNLPQTQKKKIISKQTL